MSILKRPIITEKVAAMSSQGKYAFEVALKANKIEIKKAIEKLYGVNVKDVNTMRVNGKSKTRSSNGRFVTGKTSTYKKAIVRVAEGQTIDIYGEA